METASKTVAAEILRQLGAHKFLAMTGAKVWTYTENSLTFKLAKSISKANRLIIKLNLLDLYDMEFYYESFSTKTYTKTIKIIEIYNDLYCDQLQEMFKMETGMDTHL